MSEFIDDRHGKLYRWRNECERHIVDASHELGIERQRSDSFHGARLSKRKDTLRTWLREYALADIVLTRHTGIYNQVYGARKQS